MTIAVGFRCVDGVVLAADSRYSDGTATSRGQKIFPIWSNGHYALMVAGAGGVPQLKGVVQEIGEALNADIADSDTSFREIQGIVEDVLCEFYPKHIDYAPESTRPYLDIALLLAVWVRGEGVRLLETARTKATEVESYHCVGVGAYLARYLTDLFFPAGNMPSVEEAKPLAAYIVGRAKEYVDGCGDDTSVRALLSDGTDERVWNEEIADAEEYFSKFFKTTAGMRRLLSGFVDAAEIDMAPYAGILKDHVLEFKAKQKGYRSLQAANRSSTVRPTRPE